MSKYDYLNYEFKVFIDHLPQKHQEQFSAIIKEGQLLAKTSLQASLDVADTAARYIFTTRAMRQVSWLQLCGFPLEVQSTVEDLPVEGYKLFTDFLDDLLHTMKDSGATPANKIGTIFCLP